MKHVSLGYVLIDNFKSFRGTNEIILSQGPGLKYVSGVNEVTPRLGPNGAGKTTVWDAIIWCWTGYSIRGHRAADLASWGTKSPHVITGFSINDADHYIERYGSPNRLLIDGVLAEQSEVDAMLLSRERLLHSVVFGQSVDFFLDLSIPRRGELLDQVMDLDLWLKLSDRASAKAADLDKQAARMLSTITHHTGVFAGLNGQLTSVTEADKAWAAIWKHEIDVATEAMQSDERDLESARARWDYLRGLANGVPDLNALYKQVTAHVEALNAVRRDIALYQERIEQNNLQGQFFAEHTTCPTCQHQITEAERQDKLNYHADQEALLTNSYNSVLSNEAAVAQHKAAAEQHYNAEYNRSGNLDREMMQLERDIAQRAKSIQAQAEAIHYKMVHPDNPYTAQLNDLRAKLGQTGTTIAQLDAEHRAIKGEQLKYEYWKTGFKKVRLYEVKRVMARLQLETANAASALGIGDWMIEYAVEVETRSGTLKQGIQITVKDGDGTTVVEQSGGEGQRVRLAVSFGVAATIQEMAGIWFGFEVFDEISQFMSMEGIDDLLDYLKGRAIDLNKSVWLIDHQVIPYPDFDEKWICTKSTEGSRMEMEVPSA